MSFDSRFQTLSEEELAAEPGRQEIWDLEAPLLREWKARRDTVLTAVAGAVDPAVRDQALDWCRELLQRFRDGALLPRLRSPAPDPVDGGN